MSHRRFILSAPAARELDELLEYVLHNSGPRRAQHVADKLHKGFQKLADAPGLGHRREDLTGEQVLFYAVWSYLVGYRPASRPLEIAHVPHGARDLRPLVENS
jgi:toxin ParE1/3/4